MNVASLASKARKAISTQLTSSIGSGDGRLVGGQEATVVFIGQGNALASRRPVVEADFAVPVLEPVDVFELKRHSTSAHVSTSSTMGSWGRALNAKRSSSTS